VAQLFAAAIPEVQTSETTKTSGAAVLDSADGRGDAISQSKCEHCRQHGKTIQVAYGAAQAWLHRECIENWRTGYDQLDIRNQPFYRPAP